MAVLVIAEYDEAGIKGGSLSAITAAQELGAGDIDLLIVNQDCAAAGEAAARVPGIARVRVADDALYGTALAEPLAALVVSLAGDYSHIVLAHTTFGRNIAPRIAALLDIVQVSDIMEVKSADTFVRPIYAGNALATVQSKDEKLLITVRATAFAKADADGGTAIIEPVAVAGDPALSSFVGQDLTKSERPELTAARIVISGGRGMQSGENFAMIENVADKLGAAIGASRAAVDAGFKPNDFQVGQTGKVVAPELYIAVGISGAIQHLAGMKDSKVIVAINKDEEAPIFQIADYGLVGDLFKALPELDQELEKQGVKPR
ncbi:MAG: FAD-binding protein [Alphaproteobacteria bacterium]